MMEECTTSLGDMLEERHDEKLGPLSAVQMTKVCQDICNALDYLHNTVRLLHGDVKSFNVSVLLVIDLLMNDDTASNVVHAERHESSSSDEEAIVMVCHRLFWNLFWSSINASDCRFWSKMNSKFANCVTSVSAYHWTLTDTLTWSKTQTLNMLVSCLAYGQISGAWFVVSQAKTTEKF